MRRTPHRVPACLWAVVVLIGSSAAAGADTFYKWTDQQGVVHFADAPPPDAKGVERKDLPAAPAAQLPEPVKAGTPASDAPPTPAEAGGPARVIITTRQTPRTGPRSVHVRGKVRNVGGADAHDVGVTVSAVDAGQGNPCLNERVAVSPDVLHPGDVGTFDGDVDSPCLYGDTHVDVAPAWN